MEERREKREMGERGGKGRREGGSGERDVDEETRCTIYLGGEEQHCAYERK